jgi:adenylosuccinate lyase
MIERYTRPQMAAVWDEENKLRIWLEIELLACEALAQRGEIPAEVPAQLRARGRVDAQRMREIEREVAHDIIAFVTSVAEKCGPEGRYLHLGLTSSDVLDTGLAVQLVRAADLLIESAAALRDAIGEQVNRHRLERLRGAREGIRFGKLSGAVGAFSHLAPEVEAHVCEHLGLRPEPLATQVVPRDRHAQFFCSLAIVAGSVERFAVEIRHLQRSEVREVEEPFGGGQKGSSAMPHKRNPVLSENVTGLARLVRSYSVAALENIALWHERDISHSSVERVIGPDATIALDFMLQALERSRVLGSHPAGVGAQGHRPRGSLPLGPARRHEGHRRRRLPRRGRKRPGHQRPSDGRRTGRTLRPPAPLAL